MYVNGVYASSEQRGAIGDDLRPGDAWKNAATLPFSAKALGSTGVLKSVAWLNRLPDAAAPNRAEKEGAEVFRLLCSSCHTIDGYLGIRRLVAGKSPVALRTVLDHLETWRGRRMPPFTGTEAEEHALAFYLARVGGSREPFTEAAATGERPAAYFDANCSPCHGPGAEFQIGGRGRTTAQLEEMLERLQAINSAMPAFEGGGDLRKGLADYLAALPAPAKKGAGR
jgi:mono/diheme cytochrome c family protein